MSQQEKTNQEQEKQNEETVHSTSSATDEPEATIVDEVLDEDGIVDEPTEHEQLSPEELQTKCQEAEQKAEENYQKLLRTQADFDNFKRRVRKDKEEQAKYAALPLMENLLPVVDNFERAMAAGKEAQDVQSLMEGIDMVFRQFEQALEKEGLETIQTVGEPFDPHIHQAVMQVESEEYDSGVVVEELQKGFQLKSKVIRPAMVKVSS